MVATSFCGGSLFLTSSSFEIGGNRKSCSADIKRYSVRRACAGAPDEGCAGPSWHSSMVNQRETFGNKRTGTPEFKNGGTDRPVGPWNFRQSSCRTEMERPENVIRATLLVCRAGFTSLE